MNGESAYERHLRLLAIATGFGTTIFTALALPAMVEQAPHLLDFVYYPLTFAFSGLAVLLAPIGRWGPITVIRNIARVHTVAATVLIVVWAPSMVTPDLPGGRAPWVLNTLAVAAATAVIAWPAAIALGFVLLLSIAGAVLRYVVLGSASWVIPLGDGFSMLSFSTVIATLLIVTLRAGQAQDAALSLALGDARRAAEVDSRARQRARFGALVHDDVITTLLAAARTEGPTEAIKQAARRALRRLDGFVRAASNDVALSPKALDIELRAAAVEIADGIRFRGSLDSFGGTIPASIVLAMTGAFSEAIRNSVQHAKHDEVVRNVILAASASEISVTVQDDGEGFDLKRVLPERLGIRTSIVARMASIPGGLARVSSEPGGGTLVELRWIARVAS